jgi:hypothetical protein
VAAFDTATVLRGNPLITIQEGVSPASADWFRRGAGRGQ